MAVTWLEDAAATLLRALLAGAAVGAVGGATLGTLQWPIVGTTMLALYGLPLGALVGLVWGVVLGLTHSGPTPLALVAGAATATGAAVVLDRLGLVWPAWRGAVVGFAAVGALLLGPLALADWPRDELAVIGRDTGRVAAVGAGIGAAVGLVIGLRTYPSTAVFAVGEGAFFGVVPGAVLGGLVGLVHLALRRPG